MKVFFVHEFILWNDITINQNEKLIINWILVTVNCDDLNYDLYSLDEENILRNDDEVDDEVLEVGNYLFFKV